MKHDSDVISFLLQKKLSKNTVKAGRAAGRPLIMWSDGHFPNVFFVLNISFSWMGCVCIKKIWWSGTWKFSSFFPLFSCIHVNEVECHQTTLVNGFLKFWGSVGFLLLNFDTFMSTEVEKNSHRTFFTSFVFSVLPFWSEMICLWGKKCPHEN